MYWQDVAVVVAILLGGCALGISYLKQPEQGINGLIPEHEWNATSIRFQNQDGTWGNYTDLKGDTGGQGGQGVQGSQGIQGSQGLIPSHQWNGTKIRFQNQNGSWGNYTDLNNVTIWNNLSLAYQWNGTSIRFQNKNGTWGNYTDLKGDKGDKGDDGINGFDGINGLDGNDGIDGEKGDKGDQGDPGLPEINNKPIIELKKKTGSYVTIGNTTFFTFNIGVMVSDDDGDVVETNIYYRFNPNSTWINNFTEMDDSINTSVYFDTLTPTNKIIYWAIESWDGRDITMKYESYTILYP